MLDIIVKEHEESDSKLKEKDKREIYIFVIGKCKYPGSKPFSEASNPKKDPSLA